MTWLSSEDRFNVHFNGSDYRIFDAKYAKAVLELVPNDVRPATFNDPGTAGRVVAHLNSRPYPHRSDRESWHNEYYCKVVFLGRVFMVEGQYESPSSA